MWQFQFHARKWYVVILMQRSHFSITMHALTAPAQFRRAYLDGDVINFGDGKVGGTSEGPDDGMGMDTLLNQTLALIQQLTCQQHHCCCTVTNLTNSEVERERKLRDGSHNILSC